MHEERAIAHHLVAGGALIDDDALKCVRSAGNDALARGAWDEAARYYEAALTRVASHRPNWPSCTAGPG